jgi:signal transduction histidine kinase
MAAGMPGFGEIRSIKAAALRASEIVRELMIYSGQENATLEPVDISRLVDEMLQLLRVSISKRAGLVTDLGKSLPAIQANAPQIRQAVMNLITNASEAIGDRDGVIHVTTERVTLLEGDHVRLVVADTGCGMTEETQARIYDPFFTTKVAGRGLGLAAVQGIVRAHGGAIKLSYQPGKGTTFEILLPGSGQPRNKTSVPGRDPLPRKVRAPPELCLLWRMKKYFVSPSQRCSARKGFLWSKPATAIPRWISFAPVRTASTSFSWT